MTEPKGLTIDDLRIWRDALASCAIENDEYAQEMVKLWDTDRPAFIREVLKLRVVEEGV